MLKLAMPFITPIFLNIFNCSLQSGIFPTVWKKALVTPLPKVKQPSELNPFRPISVTSAPSKLLEAVALKQMSAFVESNRLLCPQQSGFHNHHSIHTALINLVDEIRASMDVGHVMLLVSVDFRRAFDELNIDVLVIGLLSLGFSDSACG
ncbi:uncharacterized protein LOC106642763 [Copidosoma floridanum]|uniref:uncharacterized protein LOC106642763 n=1 Tax=Copidosoma floridanum TaxID=29053 RepID=UPI0006C9C67E|nr:uncharacterized protein LOC106642763 [Copidosoma floridanum]